MTSYYDDYAGRAFFFWLIFHFVGVLVFTINGWNPILIALPSTMGYLSLLYIEYKINRVGGSQ